MSTKCETKKVNIATNIQDLYQHVQSEISLSFLEFLDKGLNRPFVIGLSGGSLVQYVTKALLNIIDGNDGINMKLVFCDERNVSLDHKDSNYKAYLDAVEKIETSNDFRKESVEKFKDSLIPINFRNEVSVEQTAIDYENKLEEVSINAIDLCILGMGEDGHTCSLFPEHKVFEEDRLKNDEIVGGIKILSVRNSPKPPPERITFSLRLLNAENCRRLVICTGEGKAEVVRRVIEERDMTLPITHVTMVNVAWILDNGSANNLKRNIPIQ